MPWRFYLWSYGNKENACMHNGRFIWPGVTKDVLSLVTKYIIVELTLNTYIRRLSRVTSVKKLIEKWSLKLQNSVLTSFPCQKRKRKYKQERCRISFIPVYCTCRLPEEGAMIQCIQCKEWFHEDCVEAPHEAWNEVDTDWMCPTSD